jgi:receptor expression-enhancing protein 5/6
LESTHVQDDKKWLTYWVVYAFFATAEFFSDIFFSWFPLYWLAKVIFLVWCFLPIEANGSMIIYNRFIRPVFLRNSAQIDMTVNNATNSFLSGASRLASSAKSD